MKKVVINEIESTIPYKSLTDSYFIGVKFPFNGEKGFVLKVGSEKYIVAGLSEIANNYEEISTHTSLDQILHSIYNYGAEAYVFVTWQKLYKWLGEDL